MTPIRVGFIYHQEDWIGGVNYLRNLFSAIQALPNRTITPILLASSHADVADFKALAEIIRTPLLNRYSPHWWASQVFVKVFPRRDYLLYWLLRNHRINLLSHFGRLWRGCSIPTIGWIPDFQHVHLPEFFTAHECAARDAQFGSIISNSDALIVSSRDGLDDLHRFDSKHKTPAHILRFVSCLSPNLLELPSQADLAKRYNLDRPWFHIPNQFWAHKNHKIVLDALHWIKRQHTCPLVIATGSTKDYRNPEYFPSLMKTIRDYGLLDDFRALGVLPYTDVIALMRHAVAIINPSLCEGWSTSVEECKAMGKKVILSDIAVHREQSPERGQYFKPNDSRQLATLMISAMSEYDEIEENVYFSEARQKHNKNIIIFARQYEAIVMQVLGNK